MHLLGYEEPNCYNYTCSEIVKITDYPQKKTNTEL